MQVPGVKSQDVLQLMILGQYMDTLKDIGTNPSSPDIAFSYVTSPMGLALLRGSVIAPISDLSHA
jgi:hypothetical protein